MGYVKRMDDKLADKTVKNFGGEIIDEQSFSDPMMQENRSTLRERYLRLLTSLCNQSAHFRMYENTDVQADFCGADVDGMHFFVRNLKTPLGTQPSALLRANDILNLKIKL